MQDDRIKSMLKDVEVKAPRRVWRNVAAKLDAAAGGAATGFGWSPWMRWSGAAIAFAAVVLGAFLFVPRNISERVDPADDSVLFAQTSDIPAETVADFLETEEPLVSRTPSLRPRTLVADNNANPVAGAAEILPTEHTAESEPEVSVAEPADVSDIAEPVVVESDSNASDVFARMAQEDESRFSRRTKSLYAQGSFGGNDSEISFRNNTARLSSGSAEKKTGITEIGDSEFGIPVSLGVGFRYYILPKFSIGAGIDYSLLSRTFDGKYEEVVSGKVVRTETGTVSHTMHYLGIPLNAFYDIISAEKLKFYVYGGGEAEYCVANNYTLYSDTYIRYSSPVDRIQWSVGLGLGVEFKLSELIGLYLDPSAKYYFPCYQPKSVRTERPLMFNFDAGLRFNF